MLMIKLLHIIILYKLKCQSVIPIIFPYGSGGGFISVGFNSFMIVISGFASAATTSESTSDEIARSKSGLPAAADTSWPGFVP